MNLGGVIHLNKTGICIVCGCIFILFLYIFSQNDNDDNNNSSKSEKLSKINLKDLLKLSISATQIGGVLIVTTKDTKVEVKGQTKEGANESVTTADYKSHCAMIGILKRNFPLLNVVSEEAKAKCDKFPLDDYAAEYGDDVVSLKDHYVNLTDVTLWVDPLDATQEYTEHLFKYVTTMACVAVKGVPIIGIIHKPYTKETFWAWVGNGHSSNMKPKKSEDSKVIIISRSHSGDVAALLKNKFPDYKVEPAGGSGYKVLQVVNNEADVYIHNTNIKKWDICAGNAILNELGGKFTTLLGKSISYESKSSPVNQDGLVAAIRNHDYFFKTMQ